MIPVNTLMIISDPAMFCLGLFGAVGRVLSVEAMDEDRRLWLKFELSDAFDAHTHNRVVLNVSDDLLDYCTIRQQWAERKRRSLYEGAL